MHLMFLHAVQLVHFSTPTPRTSSLRNLVLQATCLFIENITTNVLSNIQWIESNISI